MPLTRLFDISIALIFFGLFVWVSNDIAIIPIAASIVILFLGLLWMISNKYQEVSVVEKLLYRMSSKVLKLKTGYHHIIAGGLCLLIGFVFIVSMGEFRPEDYVLWKKLKDSPYFWISMLAMIILSAWVGIISSRKSR